MADKSRMKEISDLIKKIASKASKVLYSRDKEDVEQDLWVKFLETEKRKGYELDLPLIAKICWDYVNDMRDYDQRRNHTSLDFSGSDDDSEFADSEFIGASQDKGDYYNKVNLDNLYSKYPVGSKERIYLDFWGNASGAYPNLDPSATPEHNRSNDGYSENSLARLLGYASSSSQGYRKFRDYMKKEIKDYFNS